MKKENTTGGKIRIEVYILAVLLLIGAAVAVFFVVKLNNDRKQEDISVQRGNESVDQDVDSIDAAIEKASAVIKSREDNHDVSVESMVREKVGMDNKYDIVQFSVNVQEGSGWVEFWYRETGKGDLAEAFGGNEPPICSDFSENQKVIEAFRDDLCYSEGADDPVTFFEYFKEAPQE